MIYLFAVFTNYGLYGLIMLFYGRLHNFLFVFSTHITSAKKEKSRKNATFFALTELISPYFLSIKPPAISSSPM